jgi:integrase
VAIAAKRKGPGPCPPGPRGKKGPPGLVELACVVCKKPFFRPPRLAVKAKVCTGKGVNHKSAFKKQPDGTVKKIGCGCCLCTYKKTLSKNRALDGKIVPSARIPEFLKRTRKMYGEPVALAFRVGLNAMLRVQELAGLLASDFKLEAKPIPQILVRALKKKVEIHWPVDIDPSMAEALKKFLRGHREGPMFALPVRTLQHKFKQVMKSMGLERLSIHALRHTGIWNRARSVTNLNDLNYLRQQARHESIETTKLYLGYEEEQRLDMAKKVRWF